MGVEEGQGGQWTPRAEPKGTPEGPQRPNWESQGVQMVGQEDQMVGQGAQMVSQGSQMVGQGAQKGRQREPQDGKNGAKSHI